MAADPQLSGAPVLVTPQGIGQALEGVPLTQAGKSAFDEAWLQRLIHDNPACLPISDLEPGLDSFAAVCREMPVLQRGYVDNLLMTGAGNIALVEAKLFRNPEARRKVLAQALDYATGLFAMSYTEFEQTALKGVFAPSAKPASLYEALPEADKLPEAASSTARSSLESEVEQTGREAGEPWLHLQAHIHLDGTPRFPQHPGNRSTPTRRMSPGRSAATCGR